MTLSSKILFTIPAVIQVFFILTLTFPATGNWLYADIATYNSIMITNSFIQLSVVGILINKIWKQNNWTKKLKWNWTWLLIFTGNIAVLMYVWGKTKKLGDEKEDAQSTTSRTTSRTTDD